MRVVTQQQSHSRSSQLQKLECDSPQVRRCVAKWPKGATKQQSSEHLHNLSCWKSETTFQPKSFTELNAVLSEAEGRERKSVAKQQSNISSSQFQ